jgi:hypothetical protein
VLIFAGASATPLPAAVDNAAPPVQVNNIGVKFEDEDQFIHVYIRGKKFDVYIFYPKLLNKNFDENSQK